MNLFSQSNQTKTIAHAHTQVETIQDNDMHAEIKRAWVGALRVDDVTE